MPPIIYNLGMLAGNTWNQHATAVGQIYYANVATPQQSQYNIPVGWEDHAAVSASILMMRHRDSFMPGRFTLLGKLQQGIFILLRANYFIGYLGRR